MFTLFQELPLLCKIEVLSYLTVEVFEKIKFLLIDSRSIQDVYHNIALQGRYSRYLSLKEPKMPWSNYVKEITVYMNNYTHVHWADIGVDSVSNLQMKCYLLDNLSYRLRLVRCFIRHKRFKLLHYVLSTYDELKSQSYESCGNMDIENILVLHNVFDITQSLQDAFIMHDYEYIYHLYTKYNVKFDTQEIYYHLNVSGLDNRIELLLKLYSNIPMILPITIRDKLSIQFAIASQNKM